MTSLFNSNQSLFACLHYKLQYGHGPGGRHIFWHVSQVHITSPFFAWVYFFLPFIYCNLNNLTMNVSNTPVIVILICMIDFRRPKTCRDLCLFFCTECIRKNICYEVPKDPSIHWKIVSKHIRTHPPRAWQMINSKRVDIIGGHQAHNDDVNASAAWYSGLVRFPRLADSVLIINFWAS